MIRSSLGRLLIDSSLPDDMKGGYDRLDKAGVAKLFDALARRHPEKYREVAKKLTDVARDVAQATGGFSFGLAHMRPSPAGEAVKARLKAELDAVHRRSDMAPDDRERAVTGLLSKYQKPLEDAVFDESKAQGNPLAHQVANVGRGNKTSLKALRAGDLLYEDHHGRPIPIPVLSSYAKGLDPAEYFAASFGARRGVVEVKTGTAQSGYLGKQLSQVSHRLVVTRDDHDDGVDRSDIGLPVDTSDPANVGALLARPAGLHGRNTVLTARHLAELKSHGVARILVRSPAVGGPAEGGVFSRDVGVRERGFLAPRGDYVGLAAAQAISEKIAQGSLCLAAGTLVRMADWSTKAIQDVQPNELILGADLAGNKFPVRVLANHDNGLRPCVETRFRYCREHSDSLSLISTTDHKLVACTLKSGGAGEALNHQPRLLPVGEKARHFSAVLPGAFEASGLKSEPRALLLGLLLGDGCFTEAVDSVNFSCADTTLIAGLVDYLAGMNLKLTKLSGHKYYYKVSRVEDSNEGRTAAGHFLRGSRNEARCLLEAYGLMWLYSYEKAIPTDATTWDNASVASLIAGLWITDGSIYVSNKKPLVSGESGAKPYLSFGSTSRVMTESVRDLLAHRFGIYGTQIRENTGGKRKRILYTFTVTAHRCVQRFLQAIPLLGVKAGKARDWASLFRPRRDVSQAKCARVSQTAVGELPTFDLEVDHPDHLFVLANHLVVSNSSKHTGGVAGAGGVASGFKAIDAQVQTPRVFPGGGAHAQKNGTVTAIDDAAQGGHYITVSGERHYAAHGQAPTVKVGDSVEAGDLLSDGEPNPAEIVKHKGIGEGRRHFMHAFQRTLDATNIKAHRRNLELLARGLIDHVELDHEMGPHVPGDIIPYQALEAVYEPRPDAKERPPKEAVGRFLERPVLHHTIGTQIRPSMVADLEHFGVKSVLAHDEPPGFAPVMVRAKSALENDSDWLTRHLGSNLQRSTLEAAHRGRSSDTAGTSYVPALADRSNFGKTGPTKGWDARTPRDGDGDGRVGDGTSREKAAWGPLDDVF